jgi:hypothetical protein
MCSKLDAPIIDPDPTSSWFDFFFGTNLLKFVLLLWLISLIYARLSNSESSYTRGRSNRRATPDPDASVSMPWRKIHDIRSFGRLWLSRLRLGDSSPTSAQRMIPNPRTASVAVGPRIQSCDSSTQTPRKQTANTHVITEWEETLISIFKNVHTVRYSGVIHIASALRGSCPASDAQTEALGAECVNPIDNSLVMCPHCVARIYQKILQSSPEEIRQQYAQTIFESNYLPLHCVNFLNYKETQGHTDATAIAYIGNPNNTLIEQFADISMTEDPESLIYWCGNCLQRAKQTGGVPYAECYGCNCTLCSELCVLDHVQSCGVLAKPGDVKRRCTICKRLCQGSYHCNACATRWRSPRICSEQCLARHFDSCNATPDQQQVAHTIGIELDPPDWLRTLAIDVAERSSASGGPRTAQPIGRYFHDDASDTDEEDDRSPCCIDKQAEIGNWRPPPQRQPVPAKAPPLSLQRGSSTLNTTPVKAPPLTRRSSASSSNEVMVTPPEDREHFRHQAIDLDIAAQYMRAGYVHKFGESPLLAHYDRFIGSRVAHDSRLEPIVEQEDAQHPSPEGHIYDLDAAIERVRRDLESAPGPHRGSCAPADEAAAEQTVARGRSAGGRSRRRTSEGSPLR